MLFSKIGWVLLACSFFRSVGLAVQVVASVQTLGRKGTGSARLRKYHDYGGVVIVDEVSYLKACGYYSREFLTVHLY